MRAYLKLKVRNMKDKEIQELEMYHPEIYLKANKVIERYNELLGEIVKCAEKEGWRGNGRRDK